MTGPIHTLTYKYLISFKGRGKHSRGNVNQLNYVMQIQRDLQFLQVKFQAGEKGVKQIHGGTSDNVKPALDSMWLTLEKKSAPKQLFD